MCASVSVGVSGCSAGSPASPGTFDASSNPAPADGASGDDSIVDAGAPSFDARTLNDDAGNAGDAKSMGDAGRDYSTDRALFFGSSRCADAGVQLCEDFESGDLSPTIWTVSGTTPVIDSMERARGTRALHITQNGDGLSYIREKTTFPEPNDTYFGRVFVYFKSLPTPPGMTYAHWTLLAASGTGIPGEIRVSGQLQNGKNLFGVGTDNRTDGGTGDWTNSDDDPKGSPTAVPIGTWICIEWMHKRDTNETAFWWDAFSHPSLSTAATVHGGNTSPYLLPQFTQIWLGWQEYQSSTEVFESWIDEIAIDRQRIGCVL